MNVLKKILNQINKTILYKDLGYKPTNATVLGRIYVFNNKVTIGNNVQLYPNVTFMGNGQITIGDNVKLGNNVCICSTSGAGIEIGKDTLIAANCYIIDSNHEIKKGIKISKQEVTAEKVIIGEDVWLGNDVTVLKGSRIDDGVVVGAKSLVNQHLSNNKICWGVPAREIRERL